MVATNCVMQPPAKHEQGQQKLKPKTRGNNSEVNPKQWCEPPKCPLCPRQNTAPLVRTHSPCQEANAGPARKALRERFGQRARSAGRWFGAQLGGVVHTATYKNHEPLASSPMPSFSGNPKAGARGGGGGLLYSQEAMILLLAFSLALG